MAIAMPTFSEDCECTSVRVFKWNQALPKRSISPRFGLFMLLIKTKSVSVSKTDPQLQDVTYTTIPETFKFDLEILSSPDNVETLASDAILDTYQFSNYCVGNLAAKITDYLAKNFVFVVEKMLSRNNAPAPKPVIVVEIYKERIFYGCDDVEGVTRGDRDRVYSVDHIVNSLKRSLNLPLLYNVKPAVGDEQLGLIEVPALDMFEGVMLNLNQETEAEEDDKCAICLEELSLMEHRDMTIRKTCCSHMFHGRCLARWLWRKPSCPMCRFPLP